MTPAHSPLVVWQFEQIEAECALLQGHATDPSCPCESETEHCIRKHLLTIEALAKETYPMVNSDQEKQQMTDLAEQARQWRKEIEQLTMGSDNPDNGLGTGGEPRYGQPKTEAERETEHLARFGTAETPQRGTGQKSGEQPFRIERTGADEIRIYKELEEFHPGSLRTIKQDDNLVLVGCPVDRASWEGSECVCRDTGERGCTELHSITRPVS
ncbi:hypothetical protein ES703_15816 [subsurface metagenome]